jgi:putative FmdB family regulatory protein
LPLYEYECPKDGTFEQIQKFSDPPLVACPTCGGPIEKLLSAPAIQFKGTGWYITDYARKGDGAGKKKEDAAGQKESGAAATGDAAGKKETSSGASDGKGPRSSSGSDKK